MNRAIIALLVLFAGSASAQSATLPPQVVSVATVGRWQSGPATGSYRVIVTSDGWEHAWSHVVVEWLADPSSREEAYVPGKTVELIPPIAQGTAVLEASARPRKNGELVVTIRATSNMELHARPQRFVFVAKGPGVVSMLKSSEKK